MADGGPSPQTYKTSPNEMVAALWPQASDAFCHGSDLGEYDELPVYTDISSDESYPGSAYECLYHIFLAASSTLHATSQLVPYDNWVLPGP